MCIVCCLTWSILQKFCCHFMKVSRLALLTSSNILTWLAFSKSLLYFFIMSILPFFGRTVRWWGSFTSLHEGDGQLTNLWRVQLRLLITSYLQDFIYSRLRKFRDRETVCPCEFLCQQWKSSSCRVSYRSLAVLLHIGLVIEFFVQLSCQPQHFPEFLFRLGYSSVNCFTYPCLQNI